MPDTQRSLGLALGSGAARGMAHIGVLETLDDAGIAVTHLAGTSMGAVIAALYASGLSPVELSRVARDVDWRHLYRLVDPVLPTSGLIDGKKVLKFLAELMPVHAFEGPRLPRAVVATDIETGECVIIRKGDLLKALRASVAFPGIFPPALFADRYLVDGGLCNPVPIDAVRKMGAEIIVGVCAIPEVEKPAQELSVSPPENEPQKEGFDLLETLSLERLRDFFTSEDKNGDNGKERKPPGLFTVASQSVVIMENMINNLQLEKNHVDLLIRPELSELTLLDFHRAETAIEAGKAATRPHMKRLRQLTNVASTERS